MDKKDEALKLALEALEAKGDAWIVLERKAKAAICEALAEQPAQQQDGPINEGWQITVAHGHSGYGVYAHMEDYPEEGAVLVQAIEQPAQQQEPVDEIGKIVMFGGDIKEVSWKNGKMPPVGSVLYTSPPASKPWVGLTEQEREKLRWQALEEDAGYTQLIKATEAKLREKNT